MSFLSRYRDVLVVATLLLGPLLYFLSGGHRGRQVNLLDRAVLGVSSPVQAALTWAIDGVVGMGSGYVALRGAREREHQVRGELSLCRQELIAAQELSAENARLKRLLAYADPTPETEIVARVTGVNPVANVQSLRINRGADQGVRVAMPVVTPAGVVGRVMRTGGGWADVLLITDPSSRLGVVIRERAMESASRIRGNAVGVGGRLVLHNVYKTEELREGQASVVVTAGTDGRYPKGLLVGTLQNIRRPEAGMFLQAEILPAVEVSRLEEVLVLPVDPGESWVGARSSP